MHSAAQSGVDLCELRLDLLHSVPSVAELADLLAARAQPVVVTVRRPVDGGAWSGSEGQRRALLLAASEAGADWIDVESDIAEQMPQMGTARRIVSLHDFEQTPDALSDLLTLLTGLGGDLVKIAVTPKDWSDVLRVLEAARAYDGAAICLAMGRIGAITRLLAGRLGAPWTYAAMDVGEAVAPGQYPLAQMRDVFRYARIGESTALFGLLGDPVSHSLGAAVHNGAFSACAIDAAYLALHVPAADLSGVVGALSAFGFRGYSVTMPHKRAVLTLVDAVDEVAREVDAANTLWLRDEGPTTGWVATNTDLPAAVAALQSAHTEQEGLAGKTALLLGAGGVAHAIAHGLADAQVKVCVAARSSEKAGLLAQRIGGVAVPWDERAQTTADIVVNCTPLGMGQLVDQSPLPAAALRSSMVVFDTIYAPERTRLVCDAEAVGCKVVTGLCMFIEQAALQFELFGDQPAPRALMIQQARSELERRSE